MKSSSSSSPSSSPYIYSQRSRCIFSMLRRILCLPTRDHTSSSSSSAAAAKDDDSIVTMMMMKKEEENAVPGGLVARLMGLDSMPDKITRSRSLNSVDQIKHKQQNEPKRTRSKSSTYIELLDTEDDKFIVLSFHNRPQNDMRSNRHKTISADAEEAVKKQEACNQEENSSSKKQIRLVKKKKTENSSSSSDSEESSPISVFDFQQSQEGSETATPTSADDDSWTRSSNSTRVSIYSSPEQDNTNISIDQQKPPALLNKKTKAVVVVNGQKKNREMWGRVCDITVAEMAADWVDKDLAAEFEVHIMDQLFNELLLHLI